MKIYFNGKFLDREEAKVSVFDHGFLYGDGAFEGIRSYHRLVFRLKEHVDRLYETLHTLMIKVPLSRTQMMQAVVDTLKKNGLSDAYIRLVVTRGEGDLGLDPRNASAGRMSLSLRIKLRFILRLFTRRGWRLLRFRPCATTRRH